MKIGDREGAITPNEAPASAGLTSIPPEAKAGKLGRTRNASRLSGTSFSASSGSTDRTGDGKN